MPMLTWLADVLRAEGRVVVEVSGWQTRGTGAFSTALGVLLHHTAGAATGNFPSLPVLVSGRAGLPGPLANLGLARDGTWYVIAAGRANHAGAGVLPFCPRNQGNEHLIGVEAESTGRGDWTGAQLDSYPRGVAALLRHLGLDASRAAGHKEWAPSRKIDPAGWPGDLAGFRRTVQTLLTEGDFLMALSDGEQREMLDGVRELRGLLSYRHPATATFPNPVTLANAIVSVWAQTFFTTDFGPSLISQLAELRNRPPVDAAAVAVRLTPPVVEAVRAAVTQVSDADLSRIAVAVNAELARRLAG